MRSASIKSDRSAGFTLIEMLVVVTILMILTSILLVALGSVRQTVMKKKGNELALLMTRAFHDFYSCYGFWPIPTNATGYIATTVSVDFGLGSGCLTNLLPENNVNSNNFLEAISSMLSTNAAGQLIDPWGNVFQVTVDPVNGLGGSVTIPVSGSALSVPVAIWSTNGGVIKCQSW